MIENHPNLTVLWLLNTDNNRVHVAKTLPVSVHRLFYIFNVTQALPISLIVIILVLFNA